MYINIKTSFIFNIFHYNIQKRKTIETDHRGQAEEEELAPNCTLNNGPSTPLQPGTQVTECTAQEDV